MPKQQCGMCGGLGLHEHPCECPYRSRIEPSTCCLPFSVTWLYFVRARSGVAPVRRAMLGISSVVASQRESVGTAYPTPATPMPNASSTEMAQSSVGCDVFYYSISVLQLLSLVNCSLRITVYHHNKISRDLDFTYNLFPVWGRMGWQRLPVWV